MPFALRILQSLSRSLRQAGPDKSSRTITPLRPREATTIGFGRGTSRAGTERKWERRRAGPGWARGPRRVLYGKCPRQAAAHRNRGIHVYLTVHQNPYHLGKVLAGALASCWIQIRHVARIQLHALHKVGVRRWLSDTCASPGPEASRLSVLCL